jgi:hypothetical protein
MEKRYRTIWYISLSPNALALVLFTAISYGVNKGLKLVFSESARRQDLASRPPEPRISISSPK